MEDICTNLSRLLCQSGTGTFKIYYEEELLDELPEDMRNRETLEAALKNLNAGGYIDVKYARGSAFCINAVKLYLPPQKEQAVTCDTVTVVPAEFRPGAKFYLAVVMCSFLGGALGASLTALLGAVI